MFGRRGTRASLLVIDGGRAGPPSGPEVCPRCGRPRRAPRPWRERAADRLVDAALVSCWLACGALPVATAYALSRWEVGFWGLLPLTYVVGGIGGAMLGLAVRTQRVVLARQAEAVRRRAAS